MWDARQQSLLEHRLVGLQQRVELARVVPPFHVHDLDACAVVDHVLECIGEVVLALVGRLLEYVRHAFGQQFPVADVVQADVCAL